MKKQSFLLSIALLATGITYSQEVISSSGGQHNNENNQLDFTIGEVVTSTESNGQNDLTQGFHQVKLTATALKGLTSSFSVSIFPNPTSNLVNVAASNQSTITNLKVRNSNSSLLIDQSLNNSQAQLDFSSFAKGVYFIEVINADKQRATYKIIKE